MKRCGDGKVCFVDNNWGIVRRERGAHHSRNIVVAQQLKSKELELIFL